MSSNYSEAAPFTSTNAAETYDYDELLGLLLSFSKARMTGVEPEVWAVGDVRRKMDELLRSLRGLSAVLAGMDPQLEFRRKRSNGTRFPMNARAVIEGHIATLQVWIQNFTAAPTVAVFGHIQTYIAEFVAADVEKLERRHTRVVLGTSDQALSTNAKSAPSSSSSSGSNDGSYYSGSSGYASYGGARKKLTRRRRR